MKETITFDHLEKLDMRIGKVESAEPIEGSEKLLKLIVDFGEEKRQAVSGIAKAYNPEDLVGNQYLFIINLEPRKIMGIESECMIFASGSEEGPVLLVPDKEVNAGSRIN